MNYLSFNRTQVLAIATVALLLFAIIDHIWANWGLVTIRANQEPLGKVIASMERQGHANIQTDMPGDTPVTMNVVKVPLMDALETLATVTDSRWRLLFFAAGDKSTLKTAELSWFGGQKPDGWTMLSFNMGNAIMLDDGDAPVLDPRGDTWSPKTAGPAPLQTYFQEAAQLTNAGFAFPEAWNPTVNATLHPGTVNRLVPKLISAAGGHEDELFFLSKAGRRGPRPAEGGGATMGDFRPDFNLMAERAQNEINRLPPDVRAEAQANFDAQQAFRKSLEGLSEDQRRAAFIAHMQDPQVQQQMANQADSRDGRMNHEQRAQRMANYVTRKLTAMGKL